MPSRRFSLVCVLWLAGWATAPAHVAAAPAIRSDSSLGFFQDSRGSVLAQMKRVGVLPPIIPNSVSEPDRDALAKRLESKVTAALRQAGMQVVGSDEFTPLWQANRQKLGGTYDPVTGRVKPEQSHLADFSARGEYIEKYHLDGYVVISVRQVDARFNHDIACWDGACERSDGRAAPPSFFELLVNSATYSGTLQAYSLAIQLSNTANRIVYGREGGIQLAVYYQPGRRKAGNDFLPVPSASLFHDEARIDRAVHIATLPLIYSPQQIAAGAKDPSFHTELMSGFPAPPAAEPPVPPSPFKVPREQILENVHRVVVGVCDTAVPPLPRDAAERYVPLVLAALKPLGWQTIQSIRACGAITEATRSAGGIFDPVTGALETARLSAVQRQAFASLEITPPPDAVLWVQVVPTNAQHHWGNVQWDGASESAITLGPVRPGPLLFGGTERPQVGDGVIHAASLTVALIDGNDHGLYANRGGIELLQQLKTNKAHVDLAPGELLRDEKRNEAAVAAALHDLVSSGQEPPR